jgi:malonyl-CoA decarboxylase
MSALQKFLAFVADKGRSLFKSIFSKRKDSTSHIIDLCDELLTDDGIVAGITIAREIWINYDKLDLEEKGIFFAKINKRYRPDYSNIRSASRNFIDRSNEETLSVLNKEVEGKRQELIRRLNLAPNGTPSLVKMREDLIYFLNKNKDLKAFDNDFRHLFKSWFNPGFLKLTRIKKDTDSNILQKIIKYERVHEIKSIEALYRRLENDRLFFAYFHPIVDKEPLVFVQVAFTKGVAKSIQKITEGTISNPDDYDSVTFYSISNANKGLQGITLGNFLIKRVVFEILQEFPKVKNFYTLSPLPGFAAWYLTQPDEKIKKILKNYDYRNLLFLKDEEDFNFNQSKIIANEKAIKKLVYHYVVEEKIDKKPINPVTYFHLNNGAILYDIVLNANLSHYGYKESFGVMINYYYELNKIVENHHEFFDKNKIIIHDNLKNNV